jgi:prolipoprotein diacylglyceryltransferase
VYGASRFAFEPLRETADGDPATAVNRIISLGLVLSSLVALALLASR